MGKNKYRNVREANRSGFTNFNVPNYISYPKLSSYINTLNFNFQSILSLNFGEGQLFYYVTIWSMDQVKKSYTNLMKMSSPKQPMMACSSSANAIEENQFIFSFATEGWALPVRPNFRLMIARRNFFLTYSWWARSATRRCLKSKLCKKLGTSWVLKILSLPSRSIPYFRDGLRWWIVRWWQW